MSKVKEQLEALKGARIQEILDDTTTSKIEKLQLLENENLFNYAPYIQHEFLDWEKEAVELEKLEAERILSEGSDNSHEICARQFYQSKITDSIFDPSTFNYEKYETVSYADALELALEQHFENLEDEEDEPTEEELDEENPLMVVITTRHPYTKLKKRYSEVVDVVFDYCVENEIVGFKMDW